LVESKEAVDVGVMEPAVWLVLAKVNVWVEGGHW